MLPERTVAIFLDDTAHPGFEALEKAVMPIVESFVFSHTADRLSNDAVAMVPGRGADSPDRPTGGRLRRRAQRLICGELAYWVGARPRPAPPFAVRDHPQLGASAPRVEDPPERTSRTVRHLPPQRPTRRDPISAAGGQASSQQSPKPTRTRCCSSPADLEACDGSIDRLVEAIESTATRMGMSLAAG